MVGTTSACAENTVFLGRVFEGQRNYLRVRGEYNPSRSISQSEMELPPRARRILEITATLRGQEGTTSACAENTAPPRQAFHKPWNYLRVRGEYFSLGFKLSPPVELPPRARRIQA